MSIYIFQAGDHIAKIRINSANDIEIATEITNFKFVPLVKLFPKGKIEQLHEHISNLDEKGIDSYIIKEFRKLGYKLRQKVV